MVAFPVAAPPSPAKLRGGYYTPELVARFLSDWVSPAGPRLLEPSCGDGAILSVLPPTGSVLGIELEQAEAARAQVAAPDAEVQVADFFAWYSPAQDESWDGVAGNPPFIRFGNWTEPTRGLALDVMRRVGLRPTKLTNAWVPFIVASVLATRRGGRVGLVVPAEVMQVNYASELRGFLVDELSGLTVVTFRRLVFEGVLQEVVLLLGERGDGPARIKVVQVEDASQLPTAEALMALERAPALRHETEKWTKYFLDGAEIDALRQARALDEFARLGDLAEVDVGVVTGRNQFFVLRPSGSLVRGVAEHMMPLVSKSAHLSGIKFDLRDLDALRRSDAPCDLLAVGGDVSLEDHPRLGAYVSAGEAEDVHRGYKCSIRKRWWVVPSLWAPDAFLLRQIYDHPRVIANMTDATSTDTIHRVRMVNGTRPVKLAAASINSVTFAFSEVMGRSYGGGVLELEPREAEGLPFPDPQRLSAADCKIVDRHLRADRLIDALDYVDRVLLVGALGIDAELITKLRGVWECLRDRRLARGRQAGSKRSS
jgi:adenine-specific DNA methylase